MLDVEIYERDGKPWTTSLEVARVFGKEHKDVLRSIENLECSEVFSRRNFAPTSRTDKWNREQPMYELTKNGLVFLTMGFTGKKAAEFKEAYIEAFERDGDLWTTSLEVARVFGKSHNMVLRSIQNLECSEVFAQSNFGIGSYLDKNQQQRPMYEIAEAGFYYLVARVFGKEHKHVLEAIENVQCSQRFTEPNFRLSEYKDSTGRKLPMYELTRNGFTFRQREEKRVVI